MIDFSVCQSKNGQKIMKFTTQELLSCLRNSHMAHLSLDGDTSSQHYHLFFSVCKSTDIAIFAKQHKQKKGISLYQSLKVIISKIEMSVSKVLWSVCEEFATFDREFLDFASSNKVSLTVKMFRKKIYRISSYSCRGNYSFLNSSSEETIQVFISLM